MTPRPELHPLAAAHLRELRERWGVEPSLEEALWVVRACERLLNPAAGARLDLAGIPARVGASDEWLWPMTIGAGVWWLDLASGWWHGDPEALFRGMAWALAHARDKELLRLARTREAAEDLIHDWALSLSCTREELEAAVDLVLPPPPPPRKSKTPPPRADWSGIVGLIESVTGIAAEHWLWDVSREETLRAWERARAVLQARGGSGFRIGDPADDAARDLAEIKAAIITAHKGAAQ